MSFFFEESNAIGINSTWVLIIQFPPSLESVTLVSDKPDKRIWKLEPAGLFHASS